MASSIETHLGVVYVFQIRALGGAVADVPPDATAFVARDARFSVVAFGSDRARLDAEWETLAPRFSGLYVSFDTDAHPARLAAAFGAAALSRRALKAEVDPENVFRDNFNVGAVGVES